METNKISATKEEFCDVANQTLKVKKGDIQVNKIENSTPNKPNTPASPDKNPDPTKPRPGGNEPEKNDPTRIEEPNKLDPTRIDEPKH